ncbi:MAG TPA: ABC transporter permease [Acidimicrobiia bacterium]|nr:ABC transporter permease [Acidimicrobiia bacterium]
MQATMTTDAVAVRPPAGGSVLGATIASEATKLRSVRSTVWTLVVTLVLTVGLGALFSFAVVSRWDRLSLHERAILDPALTSLNGLFLAQLAIGVLGVLVISSEYGTGMIRTTLAAVPQRRAVLAAKVVVFAAAAFVVSLVACLGAFLVGQTLLAGKHVGISLGDPGALRAVFGAAVFLTAVGLLGLAFGTLLRRTAGAISALVALVLVLPLLSNALPSPWNTDVAKYLPSGAGRALFAVRHTSDLLRPTAGLVLLVAYVAVALVVAGVALVRRDA